MSARRFALAGLLLGSLFLAVLACDHGSPTEPGRDVSFQTVVKTTLAGLTPDLEGREVVRDRAAWQAVWSDLQGTLNSLPLPEVDFDREMVVLVLGPGCCGNAEILSISRRRGEVVVSAITQASTNTICVQADFTVHAVRFSRLDDPVRFDVRRSEKLCSSR